MEVPKHQIYGLVDPRTSAIRYVGKSSKGPERALSHKRPRALERDNTYKARWIRELLRLGLSYEIKVLEVSTKEKLSSDERKWIQFGRANNWPLTNLTEGGEGTFGHHHSQESKTKISAAQVGKQLSEETRQKISAACKGKKRSEEFKRSVSARHTGRRNSEEAKQRMSELAKARWTKRKQLNA